MTPYPPTKIEVFRPSIGEEEIDAVAAVMRSGWLGRGPKVEEFESEWARHIGVERANVVSVGCATEGLYQIMQDLGRWHGVKRVIIPDNSFIGTASAVLEAGLELGLCDINRERLNPYWTDYKPHIQPNSVGLYQYYGGFGLVDPFYFLDNLQFRDMPLIEDFACHPLGKPVGDYAVYSFDAMKVLTCGDGGMVYCRDVGAAESIRQATRLGMDTASGQSSDSPNWWEFRAHVPGRRSMMNDIGAAIGLVQLRKLPQMVSRRREIWESYQKQLDAPVHHWYELPPEPSEGAPASYYTYWLSCAGEGVRDHLAYYLRERGIYSTYRYFSVSKAYNWDVNTPNSHWASDHCLNIPLHPGLTDNDVSFICDTIAEFGRTL